MSIPFRRAASLALLAAPVVLALPGAAVAEPSHGSAPGARAAQVSATALAVVGNRVSATVVNTAAAAAVNCTAVLHYRGTAVTQLSNQLFQELAPGAAAVFDIDAPLPGEYLERTVCYPQGQGPLPGAPVPVDFMGTLLLDIASVSTSVERVEVGLPRP